MWQTCGMPGSFCMAKLVGVFGCLCYDVCSLCLLRDMQQRARVMRKQGRGSDINDCR